MKIENFHNIKVGNIHNLCYDDPNVDIQSTDFREEHDLPMDGALTEIPFSTDPKICEWTEQDIKDALDYFWDDYNRSGVFYDPETYLQFFDLYGITDAEIKRAFLLHFLNVVNEQFGY